jgi:hypothetical protein
MGTEWGERQVIGLINRIENDDKHRRLVPIVGGAHLGVLTRIRLERRHQQTGPESYLRDGAIVSHFRSLDPSLTEAEVNVTVRPIRIKLEINRMVGGTGSDTPHRHDLDKLMIDSLKHVRVLLTTLEAARDPTLIDRPDDIVALLEKITPVR